MSELLEVIISTFQECKESGSYVLFYFLALGLGLAVAWDRYGQTKMEDNWMVEEAKKQIQLWPFLYGLAALLLVVANPIVLWGINKVTPIAGQYYKVWSILLFLFLCAYGIVCFLSLLREQKQQVILIGGFVLLIGLAGSGYGVLANRMSKTDFREETEVIEWIQEKADGDSLILATDEIVEYIGVYEPHLNVLYGKDLYTPNLDLGIMDTYPPEMLQLYENMKQPEGRMGEISKEAFLYGCDVIVVKNMENAPDKAGVYYKKECMDRYIIYMR
ncbi:MAG: hypothetical protein IKW30_10445 [Lachnospiraceae bacterium]|nr:hypothetical protein [Lachnospiraceae bacterium]